ncbi:MAG: alpha/beta hydrolase [Propionibacteriaceae bacterium]|jgi:alpha-beta hydrolase superfamily lysophospholipase|nr:alpha/beta hydrolase [Propionibacteriaceae bacterium]
MADDDTVEPTPRTGASSLIAKWRAALPGGSDTPRGEPPEPVNDAPAPWWDENWEPDRYLKAAGYEMRTYHMPDRPRLPEEPKGNLVATLVRRNPPRVNAAVLYIHGWNEYFYQDHVGTVFNRMGYDFYALDLHRYGRSLDDGELAGYMEDIDEYFEEIDAAIALLRAQHEHILLYGHSTGGLIASLWADAHPGSLIGLVLNSPWIDLQGSDIVRALAGPVVRGLATMKPTLAISSGDSDLYARSLHKSYQGEWDYSLDVKTVLGHPIRPGWLRAVIAGQDRVAAGLTIDCPIFVAISARSSTPKNWGPDVISTDMILNVERIAARAHLLGDHVTLVRIKGALHDISLSVNPVRRHYFDEIREWNETYALGRHRD